MGATKLNNLIFFLPTIGFFKTLPETNQPIAPKKFIRSEKTTCIPLVKSYSREPKEQEVFERISDRVSWLQFSIGKKVGIIHPFQEIYALSASFEQARNKLGVALGYAKEACARATKKTGALAYSVLARVLDAQHDKTGRLAALEHAVQFAPTE